MADMQTNDLHPRTDCFKETYDPRKKLSEIGTLVTPSENSVTQFEPYIAMTPEERRELVKSAAIGFWELTGDLDYADELSIKFSEFLKDEGL
jgi:hypothetical protein